MIWELVGKKVSSFVFYIFIKNKKSIIRVVFKKKLSWEFVWNWDTTFLFIDWFLKKEWKKSNQVRKIIFGELFVLFSCLKASEKNISGRKKNKSHMKPSKKKEIQKKMLFFSCVKISGNIFVLFQCVKQEKMPLSYI